MQGKITTNINFNRDGNFGSEQQNIRSISCLVIYFKLVANVNVVKSTNLTAPDHTNNNDRLR